MEFDNLKEIYNNKNNNKRDDDKDKNYKKSAYEEDNYMSNEKKSVKVLESFNFCTKSTKHIIKAFSTLKCK